MIWGQCFQRAQQGLLPYTASPHTGLVLCPRHPPPSPRVAPVNHLSPDRPRDLDKQPGRVKVGLEEVSPLLGALVAAWGCLRTYAVTWGAWRACLASNLGCPISQGQVLSISKLEESASFLQQNPDSKYQHQIPNTNPKEK